MQLRRLLRSRARRLHGTTGHDGAPSAARARISSPPPRSVRALLATRSEPRGRPPDRRRGSAAPPAASPELAGHQNSPRPPQEPFPAVALGPPFLLPQPASLRRSRPPRACECPPPPAVAAAAAPEVGRARSLCRLARRSRWAGRPAGQRARQGLQSFFQPRRRPRLIHGAPEIPSRATLPRLPCKYDPRPTSFPPGGPHGDSSYCAKDFFFLNGRETRTPTHKTKRQYYNDNVIIKRKQTNGTM